MHRIVGAAATVGIVAMIIWMPAWLGVTEKILGLVGTVFLTMPFFRDLRVKRIWENFRLAKVGKGGVTEAVQTAAAQMGDLQRQWHSRDYRDIWIGLLLMGASFLAGGIHELHRMQAH